MTIHPANLAPAVKKKYFSYKSADLAAGADIADIPILVCPFKGTITKIAFVGEADSAGIDASNTCVVLFEIGSTTVATETYNNTNTFPTKGTAESLTISSSAIAKDEVLTLSITNGATADTPVLNILVEIEMADEAAFV